MSTALTHRGLNRATLNRQQLLRRSDGPIAATVHAIGALQAQHPASPYLALAARVEAFDPHALDRAIADGDLIKASLMRITLHLVHRDDLGAFRAAMLASLRAAGLNDRRFRETGMSIDDADRLVDDLVEFADTPRSRTDVVEHLESTTGAEVPAGLWRALRLIAHWYHAPGDHPWSFGEPATFQTLPDDAIGQIDGADGAAHLIRRYLAGFGPASVRDIAQFTMLRRPAIDAALDRLDDVVELDGPDGTLLDLADAELPGDDVEAPARLLGMWDQVLLAHADRTRVIDDDHRAIVIRRNGDVLAGVLVDGRVRGVWRRVDDGIEVSAFDELPAATWAELEVESHRMIRMLDEREAAPYAASDRWWRDVPADHRRVVGV